MWDYRGLIREVESRQRWNGHARKRAWAAGDRMEWQDLQERKDRLHSVIKFLLRRIDRILKRMPAKGAA